MLVRFTSTETGPITMFGDTAVQLIKMLGASTAMPNAISASEIPAATERLRQQLPVRPATDQGDREEDEPLVALATRAVPLLDMLKRAGDASVPVMWEVESG